jgi:hypothetical protein
MICDLVSVTLKGKGWCTDPWDSELLGFWALSFVRDQTTSTQRFRNSIYFRPRDKGERRLLRWVP